MRRHLFGCYPTSSISGRLYSPWFGCYRFVPMLSFANRRGQQQTCRNGTQSDFRVARCMQVDHNRAYHKTNFFIERTFCNGFFAQKELLCQFYPHVGSYGTFLLLTHLCNDITIDACGYCSCCWTSMHNLFLMTGCRQALHRTERLLYLSIGLRGWLRRSLKIFNPNLGHI